ARQRRKCPERAGSPGRGGTHCGIIADHGTSPHVTCHPRLPPPWFPPASNPALSRTVLGSGNLRAHTGGLPRGGGAAVRIAVPFPASAIGFPAEKPGTRYAKMTLSPGFESN